MDFKKGIIGKYAVCVYLIVSWDSIELMNWINSIIIDIGIIISLINPAKVEMMFKHSNFLLRFPYCEKRDF